MAEEDKLKSTARTGSTTFSYVTSGVSSAHTNTMVAREVKQPRGVLPPSVATTGELPVSIGDTFEIPEA